MGRSTLKTLKAMPNRWHGFASMRRTPHNQKTLMVPSDAAREPFALLGPSILTFLQHQLHLPTCVRCHSIDCDLGYPLH